MKATQMLHDQGQSLWLDSITRDILNNGTLQRYRDEFSVTGLTSNPTIFEEAMGKGDAYDDQIRRLSEHMESGEHLFAGLAIADLQRAADLFRPIFDRSEGRDGWVSMEVSPLLVHDPIGTALAAKEIHKAAARPNLFVKIPGSVEGLQAIEETIFAGIPVNVTLLFSKSQYVAVAEAYMRALERRVAAGLHANVASVASLFVSRWDKAVAEKAPSHLRNKLGIAVAQEVYQAYWHLINTQRWASLAAAGAQTQRLLWASTGVKDPDAPPDLYVRALAAPNTINTMPEKTLLAFAKAAVPSGGMLSNFGDPAPVLAEFQAAGFDTAALATQLQNEGGDSFKKSWRSLIEGIDKKRQSFAAGLHVA